MEYGLSALTTGAYLLAIRTPLEFDVPHLFQAVVASFETHNGLGKHRSVKAVKIYIQGLLGVLMDR